MQIYKITRNLDELKAMKNNKKVFYAPTVFITNKSGMHQGRIQLTYDIAKLFKLNERTIYVFGYINWSGKLYVFKRLKNRNW